MRNWALGRRAGRPPPGSDQPLTCRIRHSTFRTRFSGHPLQESPMRRLLVSALAVLAAPLPAQSLLFRSPNLDGTWVPDAGVVQFIFLHRFYVSPPNGKSVTNFPTFTLAVGLPAHTAVGLHYAT